MTTPNQAPAFPQRAYDTCVALGYRPYFLEKLALDYNVTPGSQDEELQLLMLAGRLREAKEREKQASAGQGNGFLADALDSLNGAMAQLGYGGAPSTLDFAIKKAAAERAKDYTLREATMEFGNYLAQLGAAA
jgi:hypothetical protein